MQGAIGELLDTVEPKLFVRTSSRPATLTLLKSAGYAAAAHGVGACIELRDGDDREVAVISRGLMEAGLDVIELTRDRRSLEELFSQVERNPGEKAA